MFGRSADSDWAGSARTFGGSGRTFGSSSTRATSVFLSGPLLKFQLLLNVPFEFFQGGPVRLRPPIRRTDQA